MNWKFIDDQGTFKLENPLGTSYLYFPLVNSAGMASSISPNLNGDAKTDQNTFLLLPVSVEDLHNARSGRNFWVRIQGEPWSVSGNSAQQVFQRDQAIEDEAVLKGGFLWHQIERRHPKTGLHAAALNFVPANGDSVELMRITLTNHGPEPLTMTPIAAIPIYGRSADNLRDHRHVTALLHRIHCHPFGVLVQPTMSFDERGHAPNRITYGVLGQDEDGNPPEGFTPLVEDFIGEGGNLAWPEAVTREDPELSLAGAVFEGYEAIGGLHFPELHLEPGESKSYLLILSILEGGPDPHDVIKKYGRQGAFEEELQKTKASWQEQLSKLVFNHHQDRFDGWLQWVSLQPVLRRIMGNSFLPYHDYGRGGRGWRDLWQDLLAILLTEPEEVGDNLFNNFAGIRLDGSNATIVGAQPGEFKADRNSIPRVWMDHGAWPLITTKLYLDQTGDLDFLLQDQVYFHDHLHHRCQRQDPEWNPSDGTQHQARTGEVVRGSVLEHLLVQHLTAFFNVGEHNLIRLEGGDWNDGLDMAAERGESVAFSALYAGNLGILSTLCETLIESGVEEISLAVELLPLVDRFSGPVEYDSIEAKQRHLQAYFDLVQGKLSGAKRSLPLSDLAADLRAKSGWLAGQIQRQEWVTDGEGRFWFNGYYDNLGKRVEGKSSQGVRMTLTGQVFPLMAGIPTEDQVEEILRSTDQYLYEDSLNGYHLNTDFGPEPPALGRAFGFAYGHKENGAAFSHMSVMFACALYRLGRVTAGWRILDGLYTQSQDFQSSRLYPGIPEYFNPRGRGMYPYLTGSAAWYIFTLLTEAFGVRGKMGDLLIEPKLTTGQFSQSPRLGVRTFFAGKQFEVVYHNPEKLPYGAYHIGKVSVNQVAWEVPKNAQFVVFQRKDLAAWPEQNTISITLSASSGCVEP